MTRAEIVRTNELFRPLHAALIALLRSLEPIDWQQRVGAGEWIVRDVAAHLLDGDLRRISVDRDGHVPPPPDRAITGYRNLLNYLNELNATWTTAARRISAPLLIELLEYTGGVFASLMEGRALEGEATFAVAWAGQQRSPRWLDVGREYTERWHHQDQIREAVGAEPLSEPHLLHPVIRISLLAIPPALNARERLDGESVSIQATGPAGGTWHIARRGGTWAFATNAPVTPDAYIRTTDLDLARLLMHRLPKESIPALVKTEGARELAAVVTAVRAVMV